MQKAVAPAPTEVASQQLAVLSRRALAVTVAVAVIGAVGTLAAVALPVLSVSFRSASLHLVLETADACVALLTAYLVYGRWRRTQRRQDLLLLQGLLLLAIAALGLFVVIKLAGIGRDGVLDVWLPLAARVCGAVLIALAALRRTRRGRLLRPGWVLAAFMVVFGLLIWFQSSLPTGLDPASSPASAGWRAMPGYPAMITAHAVIVACFVIAAVGFTVQARRRVDELVLWLGPACTLAALAWLNYVLFPSNYSDWVYSGDFLRTGFYLFLLIGAAREIRGYWAAQALAAVAEDRRRLARELHDGVLQELGFIRFESMRLPTTGPVERIVAACDRAVDEARSAVDAMGRDVDEPLGLVLRRSLYEVADRQGLQLEFEIEDSVATDGAAQRHALLRIAREAVSNAARHASPSHVRVQLSRGPEGCTLTVYDDGTGFDPHSHPGAGYGLVSMRERAAALPGVMTIDSQPGLGTTVTVTW